MTISRPREMAIWTALAILVVVTTGVADVLIVLEAHRLPDWQVTLQNYTRAEKLIVLETSRAREPDLFDPAWSRPMREGWSWPMDRLPQPPDEVRCVLVERGHWPDGAARQVLLVARHNDQLYHIGWLVHAAEQEPFRPEFLLYLERLGCDLTLNWSRQIQPEAHDWPGRAAIW